MIEVAFVCVFRGYVETLDRVLCFDAELQPEFILCLCPLLVILPFLDESFNSLFFSCCLWCCLCGNPDGSGVEVLSGYSSGVTLLVMYDFCGGSLLFLVCSDLV